MLPKGKRRQSVKAEYRKQREAATNLAEQEREQELARIYGGGSGSGGAAESTPAAAKGTNSAGPAPEASADPLDDEVGIMIALAEAVPQAAEEDAVRKLEADVPEGETRLDQYLARVLSDVSRARVQLLIEHGQVRVNGMVGRAKQKLRGGETIEVHGQPRPAPLRAVAEDIPLDIVYEDRDLAVINKPAGMMVHAGSGASDTARNRGTLVNALLHHFRDGLSDVGGPLRPGIVHRLDKETSGLILVAKNDRAHRALAEMFSSRSLEKRYIALVHRQVRKDTGTIDLPIARDRVRRTRMTTRVSQSWITTASHGSPGLRHPDEPEPRPERRSQEARAARTNYTVLERLETPAGEFTLLDVHIETGRTHQIRVHMQALGHPVVGDTLYGAPARIPGMEPEQTGAPTLQRNFLHAAHLALDHPITGKPMEFDAPLPPELESLLDRLRADTQATAQGKNVRQVTDKRPAASKRSASARRKD